MREGMEKKILRARNEATLATLATLPVDCLPPPQADAYDPHFIECGCDRCRGADPHVAAVATVAAEARQANAPAADPVARILARDRGDALAAAGRGPAELNDDYHRDPADIPGTLLGGMRRLVREGRPAEVGQLQVWIPLLRKLDEAEPPAAASPRLRAAVERVAAKASQAADQDFGSALSLREKVANDRGIFNLLADELAAALAAEPAVHRPAASPGLRAAVERALARLQDTAAVEWEETTAEVERDLQTALAAEPPAAASPRLRAAVERVEVGLRTLSQTMHDAGPKDWCYQVRDWTDDLRAALAAEPAAPWTPDDVRRLAQAAADVSGEIEDRYSGIAAEGFTATIDAALKPFASLLAAADAGGPTP